MMGIPYICLYTSYLTSLAPYTDSQLGRLVRAMLTYRTAGEVPEFQGSERYIWPMLKDQLDRDLESYWQRCEKNRANAAKGGRPKNQSVILETDGFSEKPKKPKEKEKEKEKEKDKKKENGMDVFLAGKPRARVLSPPTMQTLQEQLHRTELSTEDCENPLFVLYWQKTEKPEERYDTG